jgi:hypothetical protein
LVCGAADAACPEAPAESVAADGAFACGLPGVASETATVVFASDAGDCPETDDVKNITDANATDALRTARCTESDMMAWLAKANEVPSLITDFPFAQRL